MQPRVAGVPRARAGATLSVPGTVALLPGEEAGVIPPRTAGAVELLATLTWRRPEEMPPETLLDAFPGLDNVKLALSESVEPERATRRVCGGILALTEPELSFAVDCALRALSDTAALTGAVLETRVVRLAAPREVSPEARDRLAHDLREAGHSAHLEPCWTPVRGTDVALGAGGEAR